MHVSHAGERLERVVAEVSTSEMAEDDLGDVEDADDRLVVDPANQEGFDLRPAGAAEEAGERFGVRRRLGPPTVERAARRDRLEESVAVAGSRMANEDPLACEEPLVHARCASRRARA